MDFDLSDDQRLLQDSVDRLVADRYGFEDRKRYAREPEGWSREMWGRLAELGLLGLPFSEAQGGFGGGAVETAIVQEAFGGALVLEPFFTTVVLCGGLLRHLAGPEQMAALAPGIVAGELLLAYAQVERQSRYSLNDVMTTAEPDGDAIARLSRRREPRTVGQTRTSPSPTGPATPSVSSWRANSHSTTPSPSAPVWNPTRTAQGSAAS